MRRLILFLSVAIMLVLLVLFFFLQYDDHSSQPVAPQVSPLDSSLIESTHIEEPEPIEEGEDQFSVPKGLVEVDRVCPEVVIDLRYAQEDNFLSRPVYKEIGLSRAYLQEEIALMLCEASRRLREIKPNWNLIVFDAYRPRLVQEMMWDQVKGTPLQRYVAIPKPGSLHNLGVSVDVSLCDSLENLIDMGTEFDHFGEKAEPRHHERLLAEGKLGKAQINNRLLLKRVMREAGFYAIQTEWWHFNGMSKEEARKKYSI